MIYVPNAPQVSGLDHHTQGILDEAWRQLMLKMPRNFERLMYLDGKNKLKDLAVAIPPALVGSLEIVSGWAEKAVTEPANRTVFDGMLTSDGNDDPLELGETLYANRFRSEFPQAVKSSMAQSCAFVSTTPGDTGAGEHKAMLMFHSALHATGLWDRRRRALSAGLLINDVDDLGRPTLLTLMLPAETLLLMLGPSGSWYLERSIPNVLDHVGFRLLPLAPDLDRPFGRARIDRRVMSLVDRAVRAGARLDVHSELFSAMKLILLGADESAFKDQSGATIPMWKWTMSRLNIVGRDEEGELPQLQQVKAESPEPHIAGMRQLASEFSGHTGVPLGSLGIAQDNPESADAKNVAREDIVFLVEQQHNYYGDELLRSFADLATIRDGRAPSVRDLLDIELQWRRPDRATRAADADAGMKQAQVAGLQGTPTGMRMVGLTNHQVKQGESDLRKARVSGLVANLDGQAEAQPSNGDLESAQVLKAKADALGVLRRAGVDAEDAAERAGLPGVKFIPGSPITIKQPE